MTLPDSTIRSYLALPTMAYVPAEIRAMAAELLALRADFDAAEARAARLAGYTTHRASCQRWQVDYEYDNIRICVLVKIDEKPCTCGLDAALADAGAG
jgi:hypothetical protein